MGELYIPEEDADYLRCLQYVTDVEVDNLNITVFAERMQISVKTAFRWRQTWIESGLLAAVRRQMALGPLEDLKAAKIRAARRFPAILDRWMDIAENSRSDKVASEAAKALYQDIIKPMMEEAPEVGSEEAQFIKGHLARRIDPMSISREIKKGETTMSLPPSTEQTVGKPKPLVFPQEDFDLPDSDGAELPPQGDDGAV